jgi:hypothetical protein
VEKAGTATNDMGYMVPKHGNHPAASKQYTVLRQLL